MLGHKVRTFTTRLVSLEDLVPPDNFYRQVEQRFNLQFVRDLVCHYYAPWGRPSIDPIVFFKLQLIAFFEGIRSERQLMETVNVNLAHRWYIGYDLTEAVPDHSSLSKIRERYGLTTFQQFFERIVELCRQAGLVWGEELYFGSTKVQANADIDRLIPHVEWEAQQHLRQLFSAEAEPDESLTQVTSSPVTTLTSEPEVVPGLESGMPLTASELVAKDNGTRLTGVHTPSYVRLTDQEVCPTDPDASTLHPREAAVLSWATAITTSSMGGNNALS